MAPAKIGVGANLLSKKLQLRPQLCKFLGLHLVSPRGDIPLLISKFLKLYQPQSPGIRKDGIWEENLKAILHGKDGVGMPEVNNILSPQFNDQVQETWKWNVKKISGMTADEAKVDRI